LRAVGIDSLGGSCSKGILKCQGVIGVAIRPNVDAGTSLVSNIELSAFVTTIVSIQKPLLLIQESWAVLGRC
jgi:hypothetical protein